MNKLTKSTNGAPQTARESRPDILSVQNLHVTYGGIEAVKNLSFSVPQGQIITLIGANGAGKSTTLRTIAGVVKPSGSSTKIFFNGENITGLDPTAIVQRGITLVPEGRRVFANLTVAENLKIGAYIRRGSLDEDLERVWSLFPRLADRKWQTAGTLSGGEQQMLAVGRALMSRPKLMMMDEPSLGLAPLIVRGIFEIIKTIRREGITVLLIEQNANMALKIADHAYVMETGMITMDGTGEELLANEVIKEAYLGKKSAAEK
jgi:branched-chain amino acid transport system ATP-binding protein